MDKDWNKEEAAKEVAKKAEVETAKHNPLKPKVEKAKVSLIDDTHAYTIDEDKLYYPFVDMKPGQGFFVPNEPDQTTMDTVARVGVYVAIANNSYTVIETDQNGDEVWEDVYVRSTKRNPDGSIPVDGGGHPIIGHDPISRPNLIYARRYAIRPVLKDELIAGKKSDAGVLVVRVI